MPQTLNGIRGTFGTVFNDKEAFRAALASIRDLGVKVVVTDATSPTVVAPEAPDNVYASSARGAPCRRRDADTTLGDDTGRGLRASIVVVRKDAKEVPSVVPLRNACDSDGVVARVRRLRPSPTVASEERRVYLVDVISHP